MRKKEIDLYKGIGIVLMVLGHINFGDFYDGMLGVFNMPMFFFVGGLLYKEKSFIGTCKSNVRSLLFPYFIFSVFFCLLSYMPDFIWGNYKPVRGGWEYVLGDNSSNIPITPGLWFLTAYFICKIVFAAIHIVNNRYVQLFLIAGLAVIGMTINNYFEKRPPWCLDAAFVGLIYMELGYVISKNSFMKPELNKKKGIMLLLFLLSMLLVDATYFPEFRMRTASYGKIPVFFVFISISCVLILYYLCIYVCCNTSFKYWELIERRMIFIGRYSIIYLLTNQLIIRIIKAGLYRGGGILNIYIEKVIQVILTFLLLNIWSNIVLKTRMKYLYGLK